MRTYTVHEPPAASADRSDRADSLVFVRDGFSFIAAVATPLWALANGLWLILLAYVTAFALLVSGLLFLATDGLVIVIIVGALQLAVGFEASSFMRADLRRRGWRDQGSVNGRKRLDCERRFFESWLPAQPLIRMEALAGADPTRRFGMFTGLSERTGRWSR